MRHVRLTRLKKEILQPHPSPGHGEQKRPPALSHTGNLGSSVHPPGPPGSRDSWAKNEKKSDRHGFWGGRRLRRFSRGAEVSVSKSELLVAEQVERADFSSAYICSAKPPAVPQAVKRHRKPPGGRVLQGFHEPPPKSVTVR